MHFLRRFLVFIQKYVYYHFIFPKINKRGVGIRAGGLENFSKINKRGGGTIIRYSRVVTPPAETRSVCNDSNFTIVSVSIDICARIKIILQPC